MDAEILAPNGIRYPDREARSESQYRLSYPGRRTFAVLHFLLVPFLLSIGGKIQDVNIK